MFEISEYKICISRRTNTKKWWISVIWYPWYHEIYQHHDVILNCCTLALSRLIKSKSVISNLICSPKAFRMGNTFNGIRSFSAMSLHPIVVMDRFWVFRKPRLRFMLRLWYFENCGWDCNTVVLKLTTAVVVIAWNFNSTNNRRK